MNLRILFAGRGLIETKGGFRGVSNRIVRHLRMGKGFETKQKESAQPLTRRGNCKDLAHFSSIEFFFIFLQCVSCDFI